MTVIIAKEASGNAKEVDRAKNYLGKSDRGNKICSAKRHIVTQSCISCTFLRISVQNSKREKKKHVSIDSSLRNTVLTNLDSLSYIIDTTVLLYDGR